MAYPLPISEILDDVRLLLNDTAIQVYTNAVLFPYWKTEWLKLQEFMVKNGLPQLIRVGNITAANLGASKTINHTIVGFTDFVEPIEVWYRTALSTEDYIKLHRAEPGVYNYTAQDGPLFWYWSEGVITLSDYTGSKEFRMKYFKQLLPNPYDVSTTVATTIADVAYEFRPFLAHRIAAIACMMIGQQVQRAQVLSQEAENLGQIFIGRMVKAEQQLPARRKPFGYSRRRTGYVV